MARGHDSTPARRPDSRRPAALDPTADALARREEEFRRFLVSVVGPAFLEVRAFFKADGCDVRIGPASETGRPTEASIDVSRPDQPAFAYAVRAEIVPQRAVVLKRRTVPDAAAGPAATRTEEEPLVAGTAEASDARAITRADVVASVRADYRALQRGSRRS